MRHEEKLAQIQQELASQDQEWERIKDTLSALQDVTIALPEEALEALERAPAPTTGQVVSPWAVRA